jgi:hypothetical protein
MHNGIGSHAQVLELVQKNFQQYNDHVLQEKIFVHTDKSFYLSGEILWFKLYNVDAGFNKPINISKVAYVDVLDDANAPVLQAKISLNKGTGNGSFYIPLTLKNGNYKLRAYTNWMKNFSPELYFEKIITIVNPLIEPSTAAKETNNTSYDMHFFAEGGNLVGGVTSTIGFKAAGMDGKGIQFNGVIIDQHNDTVAHFQSLKFGMGSFLFTPDANNTYKAVIRIDKENVLIKDLPTISATGYVIHLTKSNKDQLELNASTRGDGSKLLYLLVYSAHKVVDAQSIMPDASGNAVVHLDKEKLGQGINHFTLFNSAGQPVCDRLFFKRPDLLNLHAEAQSQYKQRKPVSFNISAKDHAGLPQIANLSVSVFRLDSLNSADEADIASYLWLGSELKGNIESPGYYFNTAAAETDQALDNLLLTQGWSRFKWNEIISQRKFVYLPEYNGHIITGQLTNLTGTPVHDVVAYLGVIGKRVQLYGATADSTGRLLFNTKNLYGPGEIVLQTNFEKDSTYHISIANPFSEQFGSRKLPLFKLSGPMQNALETSSINMQVQNIYSAGKMRQYYNPVTDSSAFYGNHNKSYMLDAYTRFTTMEEVLREYVSEVNIVKQQKRFHIKILGEKGFLQEGDPMVLLDGVPIFNIDKVFAIDPIKVKRLEAVNHQYYWGPVFADGILSFTTYKGDMGGFEIDPRAVVLDYEGMQLQREFYSPVYETEQQQKSRLPDFRNVLYWSPDVSTDVNGNASVSFYTSDKTGKYIAIFQGLTADGQAGSYYLNFDVSK